MSEIFETATFNTVEYHYNRGRVSRGDIAAKMLDVYGSDHPRELHTTEIEDDYGKVGTRIWTLNGSPPKGYAVMQGADVIKFYCGGLQAEWHGVVLVDADEPVANDRGCDVVWSPSLDASYFGIDEEFVQDCVDGELDDEERTNHITSVLPDWVEDFGYSYLKGSPETFKIKINPPSENFDRHDPATYLPETT